MNRFPSHRTALAAGLIATSLALGACSKQAEAPGISSMPARDAAPEMAAKMMAPAPMAASPAGGGEAPAQRHIAVRHALEVVLPAAQIAEAWKAVTGDYPKALDEVA